VSGGFICYCYYYNLNIERSEREERIMGRVRAQRGGAKREGEDEEEALGLPVYALTSSAPFVRQYSVPSAVIILHDSYWQHHGDGCNHHDEHEEEEEDNKEEDQGEEEHQHDHPCLHWSGVVKKYFESIKDEELPSLFLLDYTRLQEREAAELATPTGSLGPISKPIGRRVSRINPERCLFVARDKGCSVLLKLLIEAELTNATPTQSIWKRSTTEFLLVEPHVTRAFARRTLSKRFANSTTQRIVIIEDAHETGYEGEDKQGKNDIDQHKEDDGVGTDRLSYEELATACKQTNLFSQVEIRPNADTDTSSSSKLHSRFFATTLASIISSESAKEENSTTASSNSVVLFASEVLWQQNAFSKQMEQKSIDITYQLFTT